MAIPTRDLMRVADIPEVKAAIDARDEAMASAREAYRAWKDADRLVDQREAGLQLAAVRALEAWRRED